MAKKRTYVCWLSHTCYSCTCGATRPPRVHASTLGFSPASGCETMPTSIDALSRDHAIRLFERTDGYKHVMGKYREASNAPK